MPFPGEHAARQTSPGQYNGNFRRDNSPKGWPAGLAIIYGIKNGKSEIQSIRAKATLWTVPKFRTWLKEHGFKSTIEPATGKSMSEPIFYRTMPVETKAVDHKERSVRVVASTATIDGHGEIVEQDWDFSRYDRNPVVLWNHNRFAEGANALPLGHAKDYGVADVGTDMARLEATLMFASAAANPMADHVLNSFAEQSLRMVSVGFRPGDIRYELRNGKEVAVLSKNMLLEISPTPIGSNPDALAQQKALEAEYIERIAGPPPSADAKTIPGGPAPSGATQGAEMDLKEMQTELDRIKAELATTRQERDTLDAQNKRLAEERDEAVKRADGAEQKLFALEVDEQIGKKITPAERDSFLELRRTNPELYTKMLNQRTDLGLLGRVVGNERVDEKIKANQKADKTESAAKQPGKATADAIDSAAFGG